MLLGRILLCINYTIYAYTNLVMQGEQLVNNINFAYLFSLLLKFKFANNSILCKFNLTIEHLNIYLYSA